MQNLMQRHTSLKPFARDHGVGLVCVQNLQRAIRSSRTERIRLAQELKSIYRNILLPYIADEESILSPFIVDQVLADKFAQHVAHIRELAAVLETCEADVDPGLGLFARIGDAIDDYVRWEEHTLFPALERNLNVDDLEALELATGRLDVRHKRPTQNLHHSMADQTRADQSRPA